MFHSFDEATSDPSVVGDSDSESEFWRWITEESENRCGRADFGRAKRKEVLKYKNLEADAFH
jgi:hypothetical protein